MGLLSDIHQLLQLSVLRTVVPTKKVNNCHMRWHAMHPAYYCLASVNNFAYQINVLASLPPIHWKPDRTLPFCWHTTQRDAFDATL
jgi:hypothetical protein